MVPSFTLRLRAGDGERRVAERERNALVDEQVAHANRVVRIAR
jgi:hypothetical protein